MLVRAQDVQNNAQAAQVRIQYEGVVIQLMGAQNSPALPVGAQALLGVGDTVRTLERGRALVMLADGTELLLLPNSALTIDAYTLQATGITFEATMVGFVSQRSGELLNQYLMHVGDVHITQASALFGIWNDAGEDTIITNARGTLMLDVDEQSVSLAAEEGARLVNRVLDVRMMEMPYNAAHLLGQMDGCEVSVSTVEGIGLLVRRGAGRGFERMDVIFDDAVVEAVAQTESGFWTRIQFLSGFGWVQTLALAGVEDCSDLPRLPEETLEMNDRRVFGLRADERDLVLPFFGDPLLDIWFYPRED